MGFQGGGLEIFTRKKSKNEQCIRVLMTGPHDSVKGGIRTVVNNYLKWEDWNGVELLYVPVFIEKNNVIKSLFFAINYLKIIRICFTEHLDIVHLHMAERGSFYRKAFILMFCRRMKIKTVIHHHGAEFLEFYDVSSPRKKTFIQKILKSADMNLMLSRFQERQMLLRFPEIKSDVLYNSVEEYHTDIYDIKARNILFLGRLCERKGVYDLLLVLAECDKLLDGDIKVHLCGDGEIDRVQQTVREYGMEHRIASVGWCSKDRIKEIYKETMLYILPSYHEGLPMSLLETMSYGIPCIVSNVAAIPEVIRNEKNGILVHAGNTEEIKSAILKLTTDEELRKKIGENGLSTIKRGFMMKDKTEELKKIYDKILRKG
jgi:glycosyltransferase involved in cell wall biosynthesis